MPDVSVYAHAWMTHDVGYENEDSRCVVCSAVAVFIAGAIIIIFLSFFLSCISAGDHSYAKTRLRKL